ncbi:P-selectin glycoprotein ligand 1 [Alosa pseudoharengus]|uniref:P-selectin glycoprotein ligand 1 n=1 Tax=Alosa pseudoharengus TaxID=34774 RepID=UPI003F89CF3E
MPVSFSPALRMVTMTWLSHSFTVVLSIMFLLVLMTPELTTAHLPEHMKKEAPRNRRSVSPSDVSVTASATNSSSASGSSGPSKNASATTQAPGTSTKPSVTQTSSHTQEHLANTEPASNTSDIADTIQPKTRTATVGPRAFGSNKTTSDSSIKPTSTPTKNVSSGVASHTDHSRNTSDSTTTSDRPHSSHKSQPIPTTPLVHTKASTTLSNDSVSTVSGASGDSTKMMTTERVLTTTTNVSITSAIVVHPRPHPKVTTTATATTKMTSKSTQPPSTPRKSDCPLQTAVPGQKHQGLVNNCLIAIASLAGLATFFMVCSIVLCTKLSAAKHRYRYRLRSSGGEGTEMVCISALLPDGDGPVVRPKTPKSNGALIPVTDTDGDSDCGDNLTLNSFLPDA